MSLFLIRKMTNTWLACLFFATTLLCYGHQDASFEVYVKKNDSLQKIFRRHNLSMKDFFTIVNTDADESFKKLVPGQRLHFVTEKVRKIKKMVVYHTDNKATEVVRRGVNTFSVKKRTLDSKKIFITKNFTITHSVIVA